MVRICTLAATLAAVHAGALSAQTTGPVTAAAASITAAEVARHLRMSTDDSIWSSDSSSRGIGKTARYVAEQFRQLGLQPGGDIERRGTGADTMTSTSWFQSLPSQLTWDDTKSQLILSTPLGQGAPKIVNERSELMEKSIVLAFGTDAWLATDTVPESGTPSEWRTHAPTLTVVVAGSHTPASVRQAGMRAKLVFYVPPPGMAVAVQQQVIAALAETNRVIVLGAEDSATAAAAAPRSVVVINRYMEKALNVRGWAVRVRSEAMAAWLAAAGIDVARFRAERAATIHEIAAMQVEFRPGFAPVTASTAKTANVVGLLEGRGPQFSKPDYYPWTEYVVFAAPMDSLDSQGGIAGLLALAKAFSMPDARPRRSLLFVALTGGGKDLRGGDFFTNNGDFISNRPVIMERVAAALAFDLRTRAADSVWIAGLQDLEFAKRPQWVIAEHPDLGVTVVDDGTSADPAAWYASFVRKAVPSLYVHGGGAEASPAPVDAQRAARILQLIFYVGYELGDSEARPSWGSAGRRNRVRWLGE